MNEQQHKARWSLTAFVLIVASLFAIMGFRHFSSAAIFMAVVVAIVAAVHAARRWRRS